MSNYHFCELYLFTFALLNRQKIGQLPSGLYFRFRHSFRRIRHPLPCLKWNWASPVFWTDVGGDLQLGCSCQLLNRSINHDYFILLHTFNINCPQTKFDALIVNLSFLTCLSLQLCVFMQFFALVFPGTVFRFPFHLKRYFRLWSL